MENIDFVYFSNRFFFMGNTVYTYIETEFLRYCVLFDTKPDYILLTQCYMSSFSRPELSVKLIIEDIIYHSLCLSIYLYIFIYISIYH